MAKSAPVEGRVRAPALERSPSHLLHGALQLALDVYAEELGPGAITQRQFAVLAAVAEREGLTQTDLVQATGVDRSTLADMIARMIARGLLDRERSDADARANTVRLTEAGRTALAQAAPRVAAADARILAALSSGKRDGFVNMLRDLAHAGEPAAEDQAALAKAERKRRKAEEKAAAESEGEGEKAKPGKAKAGKGAGKKKARRAAKAAEMFSAAVTASPLAEPKS